MGLVDVAMVGHMSGEGAAQVGLAAVSLGNMLFWMAAGFGMGVLGALDPVLAQARGARDRRGFALGVQRGFVLGLVLCLPLAVPLLFARSLLELAGQQPEVIGPAAQYTWIQIPSLVAFFAFQILRQTLQVLGRLRPVLIAVGLANVVNFVLDWAWIHGNLGFPAWGVVGSAWATCVSRFAMFAFLAVAAWPVIAPRLGRFSRRALEWRPLARFVRLGAPIGLQHELEFLAFAVVGLLMGRIGVLEQSGHQLAITPAALTFMVPLGVGVAASVRVGHGVGMGDGPGVRRSAAVALLIGAAFMALSSFVLLIFALPIAGLFTNDADLALFAATLLPLAAAFQLFDGVQVVALGVLRGAGDTLVPMLINLLGYWLIGFPVGYYLAFGAGLGAHGLWWGLVAGLGAVAVLLFLRVRRRLAETLVRVDLDRPRG